MTFRRYYNKQINEYITSTVQEEMYQSVMNATPEKLRCIRQAVSMTYDKRPDFRHSTLYRIAKKSIELKERLLVEEVPLSRIFCRIPNSIEGIWPWRRGSFWESISRWYISYQIDKQVVKGLAKMFRGY